MSDRALTFIDEFILPHETEFKRGHYGDYDYAITERDPSDPGGATKFGIDQRSHPKVNIDKLTKQDAIDIYLKDYWNRNNCGSYSKGLGEAYMDVCVNSGAGRANQFLKESGGDVDKFLDLRDEFYKNLAAKRPSSQKYLKGWLNRNTELREWIKDNK